VFEAHHNGYWTAPQAQTLFLLCLDERRKSSNLLAERRFNYGDAAIEVML